MTRRPPWERAMGWLAAHTGVAGAIIFTAVLVYLIVLIGALRAA